VKNVKTRLVAVAKGPVGIPLLIVLVLFAIRCSEEKKSFTGPDTRNPGQIVGVGASPSGGTGAPALRVTPRSNMRCDTCDPNPPDPTPTPTPQVCRDPQGNPCHTGTGACSCRGWGP
jgi:hypothetical protein